MQTSTRIPKFVSLVARGTLALIALMSMAGSVQGASITWANPVNIAGDGDVSGAGTSVYAYAWSGVSATVNGVSFTGSEDANSGGADVSLNNFGYNNSTAFSATVDPYNSLSAAYKNVLTGGDFNIFGDQASITLNNLLVGHPYQVQVWVSDPRPTSGRTGTITGANSVQILYSVNNATGSPGQYVIGTFTADSTSAGFSMSSNGSTQINAIQLRDVTAPVVANGDLISTPINTVLTVAAPGVLANDVDIIGGSLSAAKVSDPANGVLTFNADGSFAYLPNNGFAGQDSFTYQAFDGANFSLPATVTIEVGDYTNNMAAWWKLNDGSGSIAADSTPGNHPGTVYGNAVWTAGALTFDGSTAFVEAPIDVSETQYSSAMWFKTTNPNCGIFGVVAGSQGNSGHDRNLILLNGNVSARIWNDERITSNGVNFADGHWHHVVHCFGGAGNGGQKLYVDGVLRAAGLKSFSNQTNQTAIDIGFSNDGSNKYFAGDIYDVRVYNVELTQAQILAIIGLKPPTVNNYMFSTPFSQTLSVPAPGVLGTDYDINRNPLTAIKVTDPANGFLTFNADGSFVYVPNVNFKGKDSFTYKANDGNFDSVAATVTIYVGDYTENLAGWWKLDETSGAVVADSALFNHPGTVYGATSWTPAGQINGAMSFANSLPTYIEALIDVSESEYSSALWFKTTTQNCGIFGVVAGPQGNGGNDRNITLVGGNVVVRIWNNEQIRTSGINYADGNWHHVVHSFGGAQGGQRIYVDGVLRATGSKSYSDQTNQDRIDIGFSNDSYNHYFSGVIDDVRIYNVALTQSQIATIIGNRPPVANDDLISTPVNTTLNLPAPGILVNDYESDGGTPSAIKLTDPSNGSETLSADGALVYVPNPGFRGKDSFTYQVSGAGSLSNIATVTIYVGDYTNNMAAWWKLDDGSGAVAADSSGNNHPGNLVGSVSWTPIGKFNGALNFSGSTFIEAPIDVSETEYSCALWFKTSEPYAGIFGVVSNTQGSAGNDRNIILSAGNLAARIWANEQIVTSGTNYADGQWHHVVHCFGSVQGQKLYVDGVLQASGSKSFSDHTSQDRINIGFSNDADNPYFSGVIDDVRVYNIALTQAQVGLVIGPQPPKAANDSYWTPKSQTLTVPAPGVLGNDTDINGNPITAVKLTNTSNGALTLNADGSFTYLPNVGYSGPDSFTYKATDGTLDSAPATVSLYGGEATTGLIAYWKFDDGSGIVAHDYTGNGHDGTLFNSPAWVQGINGGALNFDGTNYVEVPYSPALNPASFSISAYAKVTGGDNTIRSLITSRDYSPSSGYSLYAMDNNQWSYWTGNSSSTWITLNGNGTSANWVLQTATYDGVTMKFYQNGSLVSSAPASLSQNTLRPLRIGAGTTEQAPTNFFLGQIDDVRLFDHALNGAEIQALLLSTAPITAPDSYSVASGLTLTTSAPGVLSNDFDLAGRSLTSTIVQQAAHGTVTFNADGSFSYLNVPGFSGTDTFTYSASAGVNASAPQTVTITVNPLPTITAIVPSSASQNRRPAGVQLSGSAFLQINSVVPDVRLKHVGQPDVVATNVAWVDSSDLTFDLNLTNCVLGAWDIVVTNPDGGTGSLNAAFTVTVPPQLTSVTPTAAPQDTVVGLSINGTNLPVFNGNAFGGSAVSFDGTDDAMRSPSSALINSPQITIEAWVKDGFEILKRNTYPGIWEQFILSVGGGGKPQFWIANHFQRFPLTANTAIGHDWTHIAATYDGTTQRIYINGVLDAQNTVNLSIDFGNEFTAFYSDPFWAGNFAAGSMSEFRFWNVARSQAAIQSTMNTALVHGAPNLVCRYDFSSNGPAAIDTTGNGHTGSPVDAPTFGGIHQSSAVLVRLKNPVYSAYASGILVSTDGNIACNIDLAGVPGGTYDVELLQDNSTVAVLPLSFTVISTGPQITALSPVPGTTLTRVPQVITASLSKPIDPVTVVAGNVALVRAGPDGFIGTADDVTVVIGSVTLLGNNQIQITPAAQQLPNDNYQLTLTAGIKDIEGNSLDGEFTGSLPSGNGTAGGDFVASFTLNAPLLEVTALTPAPGSTVSAPAFIIATLNESIDPSSVNNSNVRLVRAGPDGVLGTADDVTVTPANVSVIINYFIKLDLTGVTLPPDQYQVTLGGGFAPAIGARAYWKFDDGSGSIAHDSSGNGYDGTLINSPTWSNGKIGGALQFNGASTYVAVPNSPDMSGGSFTVSAWLYRDGGTERKFVSKWNDNNGKYQFDCQVYLDSKLWFQVQQSNNTSKIVQGTTVIQTGQWYHYAAVADTAAHQLRIYLNGVEETLQYDPGWDGTIHPQDMELDIGRKATGDGYWQGRLDDVRIYDRALSATEIQSLASGSAISDYNGNSLDGDFSGTFPSGNGIAGGDFVATFTIPNGPVAQNGFFNTSEDTPVSGNLAASSILSPPLLYSVVNNGTLGVAIVDAVSGNFTYTPNVNATGTDTFTFKASNSGIDSNIATVTVTIAQTAPVISSENNVNGTVGVPLTYAIIANHVPIGYDATGLPAGLSIDPQSGVIYGTPAMAGIYLVSLSATNATGTGTLALTLNIAKGNPVLAWNTPGAMLYGTALGGTQLNATANVPGSFVYSPSSGSVLSGGPQTLMAVFTPADVNSYIQESISTSIVIMPVPLIVVADDKIKVYGSQNPTFTATAVGFVNGDTLASLTSAPRFDTSAMGSSNAGTYPIVVSGAASPSYSITFLSGTLTVSKALLSVSADAKSKTYGSPNPTLTATFTGFVNDDTPADFTTSLSISTTATSSSMVGNYPITVSGAQSPNYFIAFANGTLSVLPAALSVTADDKTRYPSQFNPSLTATYSGFVNGDTPASLTRPAILTTQATPESIPGSYPIVVIGASSPNYLVSFQNGTLTILIPPSTETPVAPVITSSLKATAIQGQPFSYAITASGSAPVSFTAAGLPTGLSIAGDTISGATDAVGATEIVLTASNSVGADSEVLFLAINPAPGVMLPPLKFASLAQPSPAIAGQPMTMSASAAQTASMLIYTWDFGDGTTASGSTATHVYSTPGIYQVKVTVTDGVNTIIQVMDIPVNGAALPPTATGTFTASKAEVAFNFISGDCTLKISGMIPVETDLPVTGKPVVLVIGSTQYKLALDATGKSAKKTFVLIAKIENGKFAKSPAKFAVTLRNQTLYDTLKTYGFTNADVKKPGATVNVPILISINNVTYSATLKFNYTARLGKMGIGLAR